MVLEAGDLEGRTLWRTEAAEALRGGRAVVIRRLEDLPVGHLNAFKKLVGEDRSDDRPGDVGSARARLIVTADPTRCSTTSLGALAAATAGADLPRLSSRCDDIPAIVDALLQRLDPAERPVLSAATMQILLRWDWPGNVAELQSLLRSLADQRPGQPVSPYHLPERMWDAANRHTLTRIESAERAEIVAALRQTGGNRSKAAGLLGIGRTTLYRKINALELAADGLLVDTAEPAVE